MRRNIALGKIPAKTSPERKVVALPHARSYWEYRVTWERGEDDGHDYRLVKSRLLRRWSRVVDRVGILLSREPWRYFGDSWSRQRDADDKADNGLTVADDARERRKGLPPVMKLTVERRRITVSVWEEMEPPTVVSQLGLGEPYEPPDQEMPRVDNAYATPAEAAAYIESRLAEDADEEWTPF